MIRHRNRTISISAKPQHNWKVFCTLSTNPCLIMTVDCTDLSGLLVVLVEEVVSPVLDAGLYVSAPGRPAHCPAPEVAGGGQGQRGHSSIEPRHGQTHLTAEHQTPGAEMDGQQENAIMSTYLDWRSLCIHRSLVTLVTVLAQTGNLWPLTGLRAPAREKWAVADSGPCLLACFCALNGVMQCAWRA